MRIKTPDNRPWLRRRACRQALAVTMLATIGVFAGGVARAAEPTPFFNGFETDLTGWATTGSPLTIVASGTGGITSASGGFHAIPTSGQFTRYAPAAVVNEFPSDGYSVRLDVYLNLAGGYANDTRFDWSSAFNKDNGVNFGRDFMFNGGFYNDGVAPGSGPRFVISASHNSPGWPKNPANDPFVLSSSGWYTFKHKFYNNGSGILAVDLSILDSSGNTLKTWTLSNPADLAGPTDVDPRYGWIITNTSSVISAFDNTRLRFNQPAVTLEASSPAAVGSTQTLFESGGAGTGDFVFSVGASTACSVSGDQLTITGTGSCVVTVTREGDDNYEPSDPSDPVTVVVTNDLEDETTGQTINGQTAKNVPYGTHVYGSTWSVVDEWATGRLMTPSPADDYDERVVDDGTGNIVWRLSNAVTGSGYSDQPNSPSALLPAGETGSSLWNDRGPNNAAPTGPATRANAATTTFSASLDFKSATGAAQPGLLVVLSAQPRQTNIRMTWLRISDTGSGFNLDFNDVQAGGSFVQTTVATGLSYSGWHHVEMFHEFVDGLNMDGSGNDIVKIVVDGVLVHTGTTWEGYYPTVLDTRLYAVDAVMFRVAGTAAPGTAGNGFFFDNVAIDNQPFRLDQPALTVNAASPVAIGSTQTLTTSGGAGTGEVKYSVGASTGCSVVDDQLTVNSGGSCVVTAAKAGDDDYKPSATSAPVSIGTGNNLVVNPITPVYDANNVTGVQADSAPGFGTGSLASNGVAKTDIYLTPAMLFGGPITLGDIQSIRYWTKKGTTHAIEPRDWYLAIYTNPFPGDVSTPGWYGDRIGTEPYFSASISDPINTWNQWASDGSSNTLRFFQSTAGAPGATLGSYTDPHWDTFVAGNSTGTAIPLAGHSILFLSVQTASNWAAGFTGQLDGLRIELTDGSVANVNFEFQCVADAECDTNGECTVDTCNVGDGTCSTAFLPSSTECRAVAGDCDVAENCTGGDVDCPVDGFVVGGTDCRAGSGDMCDPTETCTGVGPACPTDVITASGTACRTGSGDMCDPTETCTGVATTACPADVVLPNTTVCNAGSSDLCDVDQLCTGTAGEACPTDAVAPSGTVCRAGSGDMCDPTETCTGVADEGCPADVLLPDTTVCRAGSGDMCNPTEYCTGSPTAACPSDSYLASNAVCRADTGDCDVAENCPGTPAACPADAFEPSETLCTDDGDECTRDRCDGANACLHPPIVLAQTCNWLITGGSDTRAARARTREGAALVGDVCADKGEMGQASLTATDCVWALLGQDVKTLKVRPDAEMEGTATVVTAGGCVNGLKGVEVFATGMPSICPGDGLVTLAGGGSVDATGTDPRIDDCETARSQVGPDRALLDGLPATQDLGRLDCSDTAPCVIEADAGLNVIDIARMKVANFGVVTIDAQGNTDAVVILRIARGLKASGQTTFQLVGGAQPQNVLFYARTGKCDFGVKTVGAGALFCPEGKVRMKLQSEWDGALVGGRNIDIGDNSILVHVPFTGLAD